jgi:uncharacterized protein
MLARSPARLLRVHISEADRIDGKPLYEAVLAKCRELGIAGATVLRGLEGYGETAELHRAHLVRGEAPIVVVVIDTAENIARLIPVLEVMIRTGVLATSDVEVIRIRQPE